MAAMRLARESGLNKVLDEKGYDSSATIQDGVEAILWKHDAKCSLHDFLQLMLPLTAPSKDFQVGSKPHHMTPTNWKQRESTIFWKHDKVVQNTPDLPPVLLHKQVSRQQQQVSYPEQISRQLVGAQRGWHNDKPNPPPFSARREWHEFHNTMEFVHESQHRNKWKGIFKI
jgi:hypothetical protein